MRFFFVAILVALFAGCMASDISLDELYKRAEEQSHPKPAPKVDREQEEWSTDNLLGWNKPNEQDEVINSMLKRHNIQSKELDDDENEVVAEPKVAPKLAHKAVHETHKAKVKAVKVALVSKGLAKAKKVQKVQKKAQKKAVKKVHKLMKASPASIVPESEHAEMVNSHFFDGSTSKPKAKKVTGGDGALSGMHLMGMAPALHPSAHATNALSNMASDLLSEATENVNAKAAKKAAAVKAVKSAASAKVAQAKAAKAAKAAQAEKAAAAVDPFNMDLSEAEGKHAKVIDEKKLPSLGSFLGDSMDDDDEY